MISHRGVTQEPTAEDSLPVTKAFLMEVPAAPAASFWAVGKQTLTYCMPDNEEQHFGQAFKSTAETQAPFIEPAATLWQPSAEFYQGHAQRRNAKKGLCLHPF